ncbi:flagellar hook basal-body protein [Acinetobacter sp. 3657]|uniref:flagellar hook basal-body protein n=1 Tax=Acinetobacter sp. 3657 TaxID=2817764 RepID=UPI00286295E6|nr:flagellar basal-body rod protein FlgG [Prolinoborus sp. 3657]
MTDPIMQLAQVIQQEFNALKTISQNTANISTIGYRSENVFSTLAPSSSVNKSFSDLGDRQTTSYLNSNNGSFLDTNRVLDFALSGKGWFVVATNEGFALTRDGHFHIDKNGYLLTRQGLSVLGQEANPIVISEKNLEAIKVDSNGNIMDLESNTAINQILIVYAESDDVKAEGNALYSASTVKQADQSEYQIYQGKLEQSNAMMSQDMVKIMELSRHIESLQRAVNTYDNLLDSGINQLGK